MDETMHVIRETSRNMLLLNRRRLRDEETDVRRAISDLRISPASVSQIADKLKHKSDISVKELQTLKNLIINDSRNIEIVLNTNGALRGLVRELTGRDVCRQCAAAGCVCNLSLGDARAAAALGKAAGPYLVAALDTLTTDLAITCAWSIGNLAGSGPKACSIVVAQGAVTKLTQMLAAPDDDIQDAALYALLHIAYQLKDDLRAEHLEIILQALSRVRITQSSSQLLFVISCHTNFSTTTITEEFLNKLLQALPVSIDKYLNNTESYLVYILRSLANMNVGNIYMTVLEYFYVNNFNIVCKKLLDTNVSECLLWLLGNLFNYRNDHVFFVDFLS